MAKRQLELINRANSLCIELEQFIAAQVKIHHQDILIACEPFFREFLNRIYKWNLKDDNSICGRQQDSFDLSDRDRRIAVQVTNTTTPAKIRKTLDTFMGRHNQAFDRLLFVYPVTQLPKCSSSFSNLHRGFDFIPSRDRLGFSQLLLDSKGLNLDELESLVQFLENSITTVVHSGTTSRFYQGNSIESEVFSTYSKVYRPAICDQLVGRNEELERLISMKGDRLVVGQPGIGKTSLLIKLAESHGGLFLRDHAESSLVNAIRNRRPSLILVDDAHLRISEIERLNSIRHELKVDFEIVADCWPHEKVVLAATMRIGKGNVLELTPLSNQMIIEMANEIGIYGPEYFFHHLVRQTLGYPGRAVMLLESCKNGTPEDIKNFFSGESISRWAKLCLKNLDASDATDVVACLAMGGDDGTDLNLVSEVLGWPVGKIEKAVSELSFGGLVEQKHRGRFAVYPSAMRGAFVRDYFYGNVQRSTEPFLSHWSTRSQAVLSIADAYNAGANVSRRELMQLAKRVDSIECWKHIVYMDEQIAEWVFEEKPDLFKNLDYVFLEALPHKALRRLIRDSKIVDRPNNPPPEYPIRRVSDWACAGTPGKSAVERRRSVLDATIESVNEGINPDFAYQFLKCAVSPTYETNDQDPANFDRWILKRGAVTVEDLVAMGEFWTEILDVVKSHPPSDWQPILDAVREWLLPYPIKGFTDEHWAELKTSGTVIIGELCSLAKDQPGAISSLHQIAPYHEICIEQKVDQEFAILFPQEKLESVEDFQIQMRQFCDAASELGAGLASLEPKRVVSRLNGFIRQSRTLSHAYPDMSCVVFSAIANSAANLSQWIEAAWDQKARGDLFLRLLHTFAQRKEHGFEGWLSRSLEDTAYRGVAIHTLLSLPDMPADLTARAIEVCQPHTEMLYVAIIRGEILAEHFDTLLRHPDEELRGKIADGIWSGHVRSPTFVLSDRWRQVVIRDFPKDLYLRSIFQADPTLRNEWLDYWSTSLCVKRSRRIDEETFEAAIEGLDLDEKRRLLRKLNPESPIAKSVIAKLAGEDLKLFQQLLGLQQLRKYHLRPLRRMPDKFWAELALVALKLGRSEYEVGVASGPGYEFEFRKESERKQAIIAAWNELRQHEDRRIRRIASRQWERSLDRKEDLLAE